MIVLSLFFGALVGLSLGMTGGGGAIFAVPLLVYGIGLSPREAVGVSLAAVGTTSLLGFFSRWRADLVEIRTGLLFALAGMCAAPFGAWIAGQISEYALLLMFALLMVAIAVRMWRQSSGVVDHLLPNGDNDVADRLVCRRESSGELILTSRCAVLLATMGLLTGTLSGMFGVGGGFIIVPALVFVSGMPIQRAVGTSLLVVTCVSVAGLVSHLAAGNPIPLRVAGIVLLGGVGGLFLGQRIGRKLPGPVLQRVFAVAILMVAAFVFVRNLAGQ